MDGERTYTVFAGQRLIFSGGLEAMVARTKEHLDGAGASAVLVFEDQTGNQVDFDFIGTPEEVMEKLERHPLYIKREEQGPARTGPGRPKLGVVSREVSLLPRHWAWLDSQPGGISGALRRLVDEARKHGRGKELARLARDAASKFMWGMAGDLPGFEEASRALFARDGARFAELVQGWPEDIRAHVTRLVDESLRLDAAAEAEAPGPAERVS